MEKCSGEYGKGDHEWFPNTISVPAGVWVWKGIRKGWISFVKNISFEIGEGTEVLFWKDNWCGNEELWRTFPGLFNIAGDKDCLVSSVLKVEDGKATWDPKFRRNIQDWEMDDMLPFFERLYSQQVGFSRDRVVWKGAINYLFSVKSYYSKLSSRDNITFPWKVVWKSRAPNRVAFFVWEAANGAILTGDNLRSRRSIYVNWCYMCKSNG